MTLFLKLLIKHDDEYAKRPIKVKTEQVVAAT